MAKTNGKISGLFQGRLDPWNLLTSLLITGPLIALWVALLFAAAFFHLLTDQNASMSDIATSLFVFLIELPFAVRRLHDLNLSGWMILLIFPANLLPFGSLIFGLWLSFWPGTKTANKYGPPVRGILSPRQLLGFAK